MVMMGGESSGCKARAEALEQFDKVRDAVCEWVSFAREKIAEFPDHGARDFREILIGGTTVNALGHLKDFTDGMRAVLEMEKMTDDELRQHAAEAADAVREMIGAENEA